MLEQERKNRILLVTFLNLQALQAQGDALLNTITVDLVHWIFAEFGTIEKIVTMFKDTVGVQALVQFQHQSEAEQAKLKRVGYTLRMQNMRGPGPSEQPFVIDIQYSNLSDLTVRPNCSRARDYTLPAPMQYGQQAASAAGAYGSMPMMPQYGEVPPPQAAAAAAPSGYPVAGGYGSAAMAQQMAMRGYGMPMVPMYTQQGVRPTVPAVPAPASAMHQQQQQQEEVHNGEKRTRDDDGDAADKDKKSGVRESEPSTKSRRCDHEDREKDGEEAPEDPATPPDNGADAPAKDTAHAADDAYEAHTPEDRTPQDSPRGRSGSSSRSSSKNSSVDSSIDSNTDKEKDDK